MNKSYEDRVLKAISKLTVSNGNGRASLDGIRLLSGLPTDVARAVCLRLHREGIIRGGQIDGLVLPKEKEEKTDELFEY